MGLYKHESFHMHLPILNSRDKMPKGEHRYEVPARNHLVQPRGNKSEVYGKIRKGDEEGGERDHAPSPRNAFECECAAARTAPTSGAPFHESRATRPSREDHPSRSS